MAKIRAKPVASHRRSARAVAAMLTVATALLAGCANQTGGDADDIRLDRPVTLSPRSDTTAGVTLQQVDETELAKAIERYRIKMERDESPVETAGVDLTGDGQPEVLALFTGSDWCTTTGCSFVVFKAEPHGFEPVSRTTRVRSPIKVGPGSNAGWRDLIVKTGGGAAPIRFVRLGFTGDGYPRNALLQPGPTDATLSQSTEVIAEVAIEAIEAQTSAR